MARLLALCAVVLVASGCGSTGTDRPNREATLLLDFQPNGVHAGLYLAVERAYDEAEGVELEIEAPGTSTDALKALASRQADFAILDIHDLGLAREKNADIVGVMAFVQRPLAALLAQPEIERPRDLEGKRVGVTGLPSDDAVLRAVVKGDGGDPDKVRSTTIGFEAVKTLLAGRVDAATAFWNAEGVQLRRRRPGIREFRLDDFGAPSYPELVLVVNRTTLEDSRSLVTAAVKALQRGYTETVVDPESAVAAMLEAEPELDRESLMAEVDALGPAFMTGVPSFGLLDPAKLDAWAAFDLESGIVSKPIDVGRAFDTTVAQRVENP